MNKYPKDKIKEDSNVYIKRSADILPIIDNYQYLLNDDYVYDYKYVKYLLSNQSKIMVNLIESKIKWVLSSLENGKVDDEIKYLIDNFVLVLTEIKERAGHLND